jgi:hypothetical protein
LDVPRRGPSGDEAEFSSGFEGVDKEVAENILQGGGGGPWPFDQIAGGISDD